MLVLIKPVIKAVINHFVNRCIIFLREWLTTVHFVFWKKLCPSLLILITVKNFNRLIFAMVIPDFHQYEREFTFAAHYSGFFDILQHLKNYRKITHSEITVSEECIPDFTENKLELLRSFYCALPILLRIVNILWNSHKSQTHNDRGNYCTQSELPRIHSTRKKLGQNRLTGRIWGVGNHR